MENIRTLADHQQCHNALQRRMCNIRFAFAARHSKTQSKLYAEHEKILENTEASAQDIAGTLVAFARSDPDGKNREHEGGRGEDTAGDDTWMEAREEEGEGGMYG